MRTRCLNTVTPKQNNTQILNIREAEECNSKTSAILEVIWSLISASYDLSSNSMPAWTESSHVPSPLEKGLEEAISSWQWQTKAGKWLEQGLKSWSKFLFFTG